MIADKKAPAIGTDTLASSVPMQTPDDGHLPIKKYIIATPERIALRPEQAVFVRTKDFAAHGFCKPGALQAFKTGTVWRIPRPALLRFVLGGDRDE